MYIYIYMYIHTYVTHVSSMRSKLHRSQLFISSAAADCSAAT